MNNDLISRSALKDEINSLYEDGSYTDEFDTAIKTVFGIIDNAPTVSQINIFCENADEKAIADMKEELQEFLNSRPQGEWITGGKDVTGQYFQDEFICNQCFTVVPDKSNFCPNCGAKMRKGGAE